jgi:hypothetical protein
MVFIKYSSDFKKEECTSNVMVVYTQSLDFIDVYELTYVFLTIESGCPTR